MTADEQEWSLRSEDLATFQSLDRPTRHLILRLLHEPADSDWASLAAHPQGKALASWLLELPAYREVPDDEDDTPPDPQYETAEGRARARELGFVQREDGTWTTDESS